MLCIFTISTSAFEIISPPSRKSALLPPSYEKNRRNFIATIGSVASSLAIGEASCASPDPPVSADYELQLLREASEALRSLLENWERATVICIYADVPRELLEQKNKEQLLEKAKVSALFDKSASVVSCRRSNKVVRDYIGATGKGPLVGADKRLLKRVVTDRIDPDGLDNYYAEAELFSQALARASSLSYTAGMSDFDSINTFEKDKEVSSADDSSLEQARRAISDARTSLDKCLSILIQT